MHSSGSTPILELADGTKWGIVSANEDAEIVVSRLATTMQLIFHDHAPARRLLVFAASLARNGESDASAPEIVRANPFVGPIPSPILVPPYLASSVGLASRHQESVSCLIYPAKDDHLLAIQMMRIAEVLARHTETAGAILLHGALAEQDGYGVILAGPGGVGKTTASRRLPPPWHSLSDDATLIVPDGQGTYWAHPWPTWSQLINDGLGRTWGVPRAVPLKGIFFLIQAQEEQVIPTGAAQAVCLLTRAATVPALDPMMRRLSKDEARAHKLLTFNNTCRLARAVPTHMLSLSLHGSFWREIESAIADAT